MKTLGITEDPELFAVIGRILHILIKVYDV
jgi:hypothetical protein